MDYVTQQTLSIVKKLQEAISKLADRVESLKNSVDAQQQSHDKADRVQPNISITDFRANVPIPVQDETKKSKKEWSWIIVKSFLEVVGILAVIGYTGLTFQMWREMQKQTGAALSQLENSNRAWIKLVGMETTGLQFKANGDADISFKPVLRNTGNAVATYVSVNSKLLLQDEKGDFFKEPLVRQKEACDELAKARLGASPKTTVSMDRTIFPEDTNNELWYGFTLPKKDIDDRKKGVTLGSGQPGYLILPVYVGCIDYQFGTATQHHQTGFAYSLRWHDRTIPPGFVNEVAPLRSVARFRKMT